MPDLSLPVREAGTVLAVALGCGLLIGVERERRKGTGPSRALAGVRTFALASLSGSVAMLMGQGPMLVGAAFVAALGVVAYRRDRSGDPGVTTELALLLTYLIGALCTQSAPLAAGLAVLVTGLLAARDRIHRFATSWLQEAELRDGILLAALALIAVPLLPDRPLWGSVLNPRTIATLLVLLLGIQALAHLCRRLLQARHAVMLSALASGFVSSSGAIATLGVEVRQGRAEPRGAAGAALLSCVATLLQLLAIAAAVQPAWLAWLWGPALAGAGLAALWGVWLVRADAGKASAKGAAQAVSGGDQRMFSLSSAALVACLLTGVQALVYGASLWLGEAGLVAATLIASLADVHAAAAAVLVQAPQPQGQMAVLLMVTLGMHAVSKCVTAWVSGGAAYLRWLAPGLLAHTAVAVGLLGMQARW